MFSKLKQIKDLRDKAKTIQAMLAEVRVEGSGAWGKVKVAMDGNQQISRIEMADELLSPGEKPRLESGLKDALKDAMSQIQKKVIEKMKEGGMDLPNLGA